MPVPDASVQLLTTRELAQASGATARQLDYWIRRGYLIPATLGHGTGRCHEWHPNQVAAAIALNRIVNLRMTPILAARIARAVETGETTTIEIAPGIVIDTARVGTE